MTVLAEAFGTSPSLLNSFITLQRNLGEEEKEKEGFLWRRRLLSLREGFGGGLLRAGL
jgi:hypothetical protein